MEPKEGVIWSREVEGSLLTRFIDGIRHDNKDSILVSFCIVVLKTYDRYSLSEEDLFGFTVYGLQSIMVRRAWRNP